MINLRNVKRLCKEFESIENYQEAISSPEKYDCHHRNEIDMNLSAEELKKMDLYYSRPASELIFLTHETHTSLHKKDKKPSIYGKHHSVETRNKISDSLKGNKHPRYKHICSALLQMLYVEQKKSANKISQELGIARFTIIKRLRELNIPIRKN